MNKSYAVFKDNIIRDYFAEKLDLSIVDFTDVRFYSDRDEVLSAINDYGCDMVITDNVSDFSKQSDFIKKVLNFNKNAKIVVILNKDEVSRARALFKLGVFDCVIKNELTSEYIYGLFMDKEYSVPHENDAKSRDEVLREFFWGNKSINESFSNIYRINDDRVYVVAIKLLNFVDVRRTVATPELVTNIRNILNDHFRNLGTGEFFYNHYAQVLLMFSPSDEVDIDFVVAETRKLINLFKSSLKLKSFAILDRKEYKFTEIRSTWKERFEYTNYYFLYERNSAFMDDMSEKFADDFNGYERIKIFQQALNDFDKNAYDRELAKLLEVRPKATDTMGLIDFLLSLFNEIKKLEVQYDVCFADDAKFKSILRKGSLKQAVAYCQECVNNIMDGISESSRMSIHIKKYLENHIAENVTLKDLAINFNFEYNYSSKYFNKIMGMSFKKYFTNLRLEVAKNLLKSTKHKCYEIAVMCGYKNYEHFSRMFYKKYKVWPKQIK